MNDPIVALVSSYKEGSLIEGTIASIHAICKHVYVFEGSTEQESPPGPSTVFHDRHNIHLLTGKWKNETEKRNAMLKMARIRMGNDPFWILTIDADEVLIWGEFLPSWLGMVRPGYPESTENAIPLKRTEPSFDEKIGWYADYVPSRLVHSSFVHSYKVGCWQFWTPDGKFGALNNTRSQYPPMIGEPHIHHRHYMRRDARKDFRASEHEEARWRKEHGIIDEIPT